MLSTTYDNARMELFEGYMTRRRAPYPQPDASTRGLPREKPKKSNTIRRTGARTKRIVPDSRSVACDKGYEDHGAMARAGPAVERKKGSSPLEQFRGRTVYNATTTSLGPFGEILDATLPSGEIDPTLMELARIIKEERLRVAQWKAFVYEQEPGHWAHQDNTSAARLSLSTSTAYFPFDPDETHIEDAVMNEAKLERAFHRYFNVEEYMT